MTPAVALSAALIAAPLPPERPETLTLPLREPAAYDADTLYVRLPGAPPPLDRVSVRLDGLDAPERGWRARCPAEAERAERARVHVLARLADADAVTLLGWRWGKYGGRIVARVLIDGRDLTVELIERGLARPYDGGAREGWCNE